MINVSAMDWTEFGVETKVLIINGVHIRFYEIGSGSQTFLFVHGNASSAMSFRYLMRELSSDSRCIAFDLPGFGASEKPSDPAFYTLSNFIDIYKGFVMKLGLQDIVLVVHEFGSLVGCGGAITDYDKYRGIVMINSVTVPDEKLPLKVRRKFLNTESGNTKKIRAYQELIFKKGYNIVDEESVKYHLGVNNNYENGIGILSVLNEIPTSSKHSNYSLVFKLLSKLESWDIPVLLIYGEKSYLFGSKLGKVLSRKLARPEYHCIEGGSFFLQEESWEDIMKYLISWRNKL